MNIIITVITHHHHGILPCTSILVLDIADGLVNHGLCLSHCSYGETTNSHIRPVTSLRVSTLSVIEIAEVILVHEAVHLIERVLALVAEQEVIWLVVLPRTGVHTVIPGTVAEEQEVSWHLTVTLRLVVQHLHIPSIGVGIRCTAGELIKQLIGRNDSGLQTVVLFVEFLQSLCLLQEYLRCGNDNHHLIALIGMQVLIGDIIHIFRLCKLIRTEFFHRTVSTCHGYDIVRTDNVSSRIGDLHRVHILESINIEAAASHGTRIITRIIE